VSLTRHFLLPIAAHSGYTGVIQTHDVNAPVGARTVALAPDLWIPPDTKPRGNYLRPNGVVILPRRSLPPPAFVHALHQITVQLGVVEAIRQCASV
jgi:hypothetical protein